VSVLFTSKEGIAFFKSILEIIQSCTGDVSGISALLSANKASFAELILSVELSNLLFQLSILMDVSGIIARILTS
jgi:hypothetical protein